METKQEIRSRLLRSAAHFWGHEESEMEDAGFDPLVGFLMGACAEELSQINRSLQLSQDRVTNRILEFLSPDVLTGPIPAHGILHARSINGKYKIKPTDQFVIHRALADENIEYFFASLLPISVFNADVKILELGGQQIIQNGLSSSREVLLNNNETSIEGQHSIWLGIEVDKSIKSLSQLRFFFNWINYPQQEELLRGLGQATWHLGIHQLSTVQDIEFDPNQEEEEVSSLLRSEFDISERVSKEALSYYQSHFVTIKGLRNSDEDIDLDQLKSFYPSSFERIYSPEDLVFLDRKLLWIEVKLPTYFPANAIRNTICQLNCFPVLNLKFHERDWRIQEQVNIIPLSSDHHFFDTYQVRNRKNGEYHEIPLTNIRDYKAGKYSIRKTGIAKFSEREASQVLHDLISRLRDESAAFAALGKDQIKSKIRSLNQDISDLEQLITQNERQSSIPYLIVKPIQDDRVLKVSYWSTSASSANKIPAGSTVDMYRFASLERESIGLVTSTTGGREPLTHQDKAFAYKKAIVSRGRIVTREDIKAYCKAKIGSELKYTEIKFGCEISNDPTIGLSRILEVWLHAQNHKEKVIDWITRIKELERELNQDSAGTLSIRVFLANTEMN